MNKLSALVCGFGLSVFTASAQTPAPVVPQTQSYGKIDISDLEMKDCDFEKGAKAEVLFDKGNVYLDGELNMYFEHHVRIKILKDAGKDQANIKIDFYGGNRSESVYDVQAQTINLANGKPEITKVDKKQIFNQVIDKLRSQIVFSFPNVHEGSVIEYKYKETIQDVPDWDFQTEIPTRYSEYTTALPDFLIYSLQQRNFFMPIQVSHNTEGRTIGTGQDAFVYNDEITKRWMTNVISLPDEPFMSSRKDNLTSLHFKLVAINNARYSKTFIDSWAKVGGALADDEDFGGQLKRKLTGEEAITSKAKTIKSTDDRIAYVFNEVKNSMKWNDEDHWYTNDGTYRAWEKKTGNSTEINLILYHLLKQSGVDAYPMVVSTRKHGKVNQVYPFLSQFNRAVVYIPVDTAKYYLLDASDKYNTYNQIPYNLLNSSGLYIDKENKKYDIVFINREEPVREQCFIQADIKPEGKVNGTAQILSFGYNKTNITRHYKTDGEKKYIDDLRDGDNTLKISAVKFENMDVDTLPLTQKIDFDLELAGADGTFIYLNPNILTSLKNNPFLSENRQSSIDFGYNKTFTINEVLKEPAGYKPESLPKSVSMVMPDKSISFRRIAVEQDGQIVLRYQINYQKSIFFKEDYPDFREFYKRMTEMLNEQVVLKKG